MRSTTKLKVLLSITSECRFRFSDDKWEIYIVIDHLGEGVFTGKNFSEVVGKALAFSKKKNGELLEGFFKKNIGNDPL
jgi:hypothetical protein